MERVPGEVVAPLKAMAEEFQLDWQSVFAAALLLGAALLISRGFRESVTEISELRRGAKKAMRREVEQRIEGAEREALGEVRQKAFDTMVRSLAAKIPPVKPAPSASLRAEGAAKAKPRGEVIASRRRGNVAGEAGSKATGIAA